MNLRSMLARAPRPGKPIRVGLIGAGKFGSMFLAQVPSIAGLDVAMMLRSRSERAKAACRNVGWDAGLIARTRFGGNRTRRLSRRAHRRRDRGDPAIRRRVLRMHSGDRGGQAHRHGQCRSRRACGAYLPAKHVPPT